MNATCAPPISAVARFAMNAVTPNASAEPMSSPMKRSIRRRPLTTPCPGSPAGSRSKKDTCRRSRDPARRAPRAADGVHEEVAREEAVEEREQQGLGRERQCGFLERVRGARGIVGEPREHALSRAELDRGRAPRRPHALPARARARGADEPEREL